MTQPDSFWTDLLAFIKAGRVIPVVGERAVTFGKDDRPVYPFLAADLVKRLNLARDRRKVGIAESDS
jgi:hypothetical protein